MRVLPEPEGPMRRTLDLSMVMGSVSGVGVEGKRVLGVWRGAGRPVNVRGSVVDF